MNETQSQFEAVLEKMNALIPQLELLDAQLKDVGWECESYHLAASWDHVVRKLEDAIEYEQRVQEARENEEMLGSVFGSAIDNLDEEEEN